MTTANKQGSLRSPTKDIQLVVNCNAFASSTLLRLFFTYSAVFVGKGAKIVLSSGIGTLAMPLIKL